ncbi:hypothetical protein JEZ13_00795 [bacterium]|nr:hypothetical protein [bacterium]
MRKIFITFFLLCSSFLFARTVFQAEIVDSLISQLENHLKSNESYYLITSENEHLDRYFKQKMLELGVNIYLDKAMASKSIQSTLTSEISFNSKRTLFFNRQIKEENYFAQALIIDNKSSKIEQELNFNKIQASPIPDGNISIWKPALISLIAGTLIYSLWSIE